MKKSAKLSIVAGALALCTCFGVVALSGCNKGSSFDPWANMTATTYHDFSTHTNSYELGLNAKLGGIKAQKAIETDSSQFNYTLHYKITDNKEYAYYEFNGTEDVPDGSTKTLNAKIWLIDNIMYVDNGEMKYSAPYQKGLEDIPTDNTSPEYVIFNKSLDSAISDLSKIDSLAKPAELNNRIRSHLEYSVIYKTTTDEANYYKIDYNHAETLGASLKTTNFVYRFGFYKQSLSFFGDLTIITEDGVTTKTDTTYEALTAAITLPGQQKDWPSII